MSADMKYIQSHLPLALFFPNFTATILQVIRRIHLYIMNQTGIRGDIT